MAMLVETNIIAKLKTTKLSPTHKHFSKAEKGTRRVLIAGLGVTAVLCTGVVAAPGVRCGNSRANPFWAIVNHSSK